MTLDEQIVQMHLERTPHSFIRRKLKVDHQKITETLAAAKVPLNRTELLRYRAQGLYEKHNGCFASIARELKVSRERIRQVMIATELNPSGIRPKALRLVEQVCKLVQEGKTNREINEELNISISHINNILRNAKLKSNQKSKSKYCRENLIQLYQKHHGNYSSMAREMGVQNIALLFIRLKLNKDYPGLGRFSESKDKRALIS